MERPGVEDENLFFPAKVYCAQSLLDGRRESIVIDYAFSDEQRAAIRAALSEPPPEPSAEREIAMTLATFGCINCHVRDDYGGVAADANAYFRTTEHDLGDEARIPPPLTLTGALPLLESPSGVVTRTSMVNGPGPPEIPTLLPLPPMSSPTLACSGIRT